MTSVEVSETAAIFACFEKWKSSCEIYNHFIKPTSFVLKEKKLNLLQDIQNML